MFFPLVCNLFMIELYIQLFNLSAPILCRAITAHGENVPVDQEPETSSRIHTNEYLNKLIISDAVSSDPLYLQNNWLSETNKSGLSQWPSVHFMDIEKYLRILNISVDLMCRLKSDYKEGKAY